MGKQASSSSAAAMVQVPQTAKVYIGTFIHSKSLSELEYLHDTIVGVDEKGIIAFVEKVEEGDADVQKLGEKFGTRWEGKVDVMRSGEGNFFFPGFVDTHIHASQFPNAGIFGKSTLLDWLNTYTFPMESSLSTLPRAQKVYKRCIQRTLCNGTTTASYYATIDVGSTNLLADLCLSLGQRAFIGRVCMDTLSPDFYRDESPEQAVEDTRATIKYIASIDSKNDLITPIITPRFAPSCSSELMHALGHLHAETNLPIQTHISENVSEIALVKSLFPSYSDYTSVYDAHGLLTPKTILAHGVHLSPDEVDLIVKREAKISHCPASNSAITSGEAKVRWLLDKGVEVGLGTDMSGGYSPSILEAARQAGLVSRHVAMHIEDDVARERTKLSIEEVLYLGTRGGAKVVGLGSKIGGFEVGKEFDAQLIGLGGNVGEAEGEEDGGSGPVDMFGWESWEERIAKWVYNGDDRNVVGVWVRGRLVHEKKRKI